LGVLRLYNTKSSRGEMARQGFCLGDCNILSAKLLRASSRSLSSRVIFSLQGETFTTKSTLGFYSRVISLLDSYYRVSLADTPSTGVMSLVGLATLGRVG
jgi:hypothetical protein